MLRSLLLPALALVPLAACAVSPTDALAPHIDRTLTTTADAEVMVTPDQAIMSFSVTATGADAMKAIAAVDGPTARVLAAAKKRGVKAEHLQSAQVMIQPAYVYDKKGRAKQVGITGTRTINVILEDLTKLDLVVSEALAAVSADDANSGTSITLANMRFDDSHLTEHKALARVHAAQAAKKKAQSLAETLGAKLGPPRLVQEGGDVSLRGYELWQNVSYNVEKDLTHGGIVTDTFAPGQVTVSAGVSVVFDLEA